MSRGPTKIWCEMCEASTPCRVTHVEGEEDTRGGRFYFLSHPDINFFQRYRVCEECGHDFYTAEVSKDFLHELLELRDTLQDLKGRSQEYQNAALEASNSLAMLTESLGKLKGLK